MVIKQQPIVRWNGLVIGLNLIGLGPYYAISRRLKVGSYIVTSAIVLLFIIFCFLNGLILLTSYSFITFAFFQRTLLAFLLYMCFLVMISKKWNKLTKLWHFSNLVPSSRWRIYEIYGIFLVNIVERCFLLRSIYDEVIQESGLFSFEDYFKAYAGKLSEYFGHLPIINITLFVFTIITLFIYSLVNAFLLLLITKFVSQLEHFNMMVDKHISKSNGIYVEHNHCIKAKVEYYWMCSRKEYNKLCDLFDAINDFCSPTIFFYLLSVVMNVFVGISFIISNAGENSIRFRSDNLVILISETMRLRAILMTAADIPASHRKIVYTMFKMSQYDYNLESSLLLTQVTLTKMNIKIAGVYKATRDFIVTLVEHMVSYNLIILQLLPYLMSSFRFTDEDGVQKIVSEKKA